MTKEDLLAVFSYLNDCVKDGLMIELRQISLMKFLANENFARQSIDKLRQHNFDVLSIAESYSGIPDEKVMNMAKKR